jgi:integrase
MLKTKYYLHSKVTKDKRRSLYLSVSLDGNGRLQQAVGESLKESEWNPKTERVTARHEWHESINKRLDRLRHKVQADFREMLDAGELPTGSDLRLILRPLREQKMQQGGPPEVRQVYEEWKAAYLKRKNRGVDISELDEKQLMGYNYARIFAQVVTALEDFKPGITVRDLTAPNWELYLDHLYNEMEVEDSTVATHIKGWKAFREHAGLSTSEPWLKNTYHRSKLLPDLTWQELLQLISHNYQDAKLQEAAHAFAINCQLALRWGDLSTLTPAHLHTVNSDQYGQVLCVRKRMGKTGGVAFVPLPPLARELFDKYSGIPLPQGAKNGKPHLQEYNKLVKKAAKEAKLNRLVTVETFKAGRHTETQRPLHEVLSSHTARHTAASRIREASDYETAQILLGHAMPGNTGGYAHLNPVATAERLLRAWEHYTKKGG